MDVGADERENRASTIPGAIGMTAVSLLLAILGGAATTAGVAFFVTYLIGIRRGARTANLERGYMQATVVAGGLALLDWGVGWSGEPTAVFGAGWIVLGVLFVAVIWAIAPR